MIDASVERMERKTTKMKEGTETVIEDVTGQGHHDESEGGLDLVKTEERGQGPQEVIEIKKEAIEETEIKTESEVTGEIVTEVIATEVTATRTEETEATETGIESEDIETEMATAGLVEMKEMTEAMAKTVMQVPHQGDVMVKTLAKRWYA